MNFEAIDFDSFEHIYAAIDLKSFYASVECIDRNLDPLTTNLVVADSSRTEKTICLAVTPSLKAYGIPGRARLFEVIQSVDRINSLRLDSAPGHTFSGSSCDCVQLAGDPSLKLDYITAVPRMSRYMQCSTDIYRIYLKYFSHEDIHVYSCDEVFIDITRYMNIYRMRPDELIRKVVLEIYDNIGVTATAGIGSNLYLSKIAMDVYAKHIPADEYGVRIAVLDEAAYRHNMWSHRPITDFWRVGGGTARKLYSHGMYTMGDVALCSHEDEELLYRLFGVNAELLIDHAWGYESCTISDIKAYRPKDTSLSSGQVLMRPYSNDEARIIVREMADVLSLDLVDKELTADKIVLTIGYDKDSLDDPDIRRAYRGEITKDWYGRMTPKSAHGTATLPVRTASTRLITEAAVSLYDKITDPLLTVRRITVSAEHTLSEDDEAALEVYEQLSLFDDDKSLASSACPDTDKLNKEKALQKATLELKKRFGKNAVIKGTDLQEGATMIERNNQIGGHKA